MTLPPRKEQQQIMLALMRWFESQSISTDTAAFVMSTLVGRLTAEIFADDRNVRKIGLKVLIAEMTQALDDDDN